MAPLAAVEIPDKIWDGSSKLLDRLKSYYHAKDDAEIPPAISERTALACAVLFTAIYVAPFYLSSTLRATPLSSRDAPTVIKARIRAVALTCVTCTVITIYVLAIYGHATPHDVLRLFGAWPVYAIDALKVLGLVAVLFVGPLYECLLIDGGWRDLTPMNAADALWDSWVGHRNLVVAPLSEELVFRSLTVSLCLLAKVQPSRIVFVTPLIFGLAHIHHLVEFLQSRTPQGHRSPPLAVWINGIIRSLFQLTYTSLFGFFAAFVLLRTGNIYAAILAHAFCNSMGVPRISGKVGQYSNYPTNVTPDVAQAKRDDIPNGQVSAGNSLREEKGGEDKPTATFAGPRNLRNGWSVAYYALLVVGAFGFYKLLWPWTESQNALAVFGAEVADHER